MSLSLHRISYRLSDCDGAVQTKHSVLFSIMPDIYRSTKMGVNFHSAEWNVICFLAYSSKNAKRLVLYFDFMCSE